MSQIIKAEKLKAGDTILHETGRVLGTVNRTVMPRGSRRAMTVIFATGEAQVYERRQEVQIVPSENGKTILSPEETRDAMRSVNRQLVSIREQLNAVVGPNILDMVKHGDAKAVDSMELVELQMTVNNAAMLAEDVLAKLDS